MRAMTTGVRAPVAVASLDAVLAVATTYPVFPCGLNKQPHTAHGFKDASQDEGQITAWWRTRPDALVGVPTGIHTRIVVIDYDPDKADAGTRDWVEKWSSLLSSTFSTETPRGGRHWYFQSDESYASGANVWLAGKQRRGLDIRADGGYVIYWPVHGLPSIDESLADIPPGFLDDRKRVIPTNRTAPKRPQELLVRARQWAHERDRVIKALAYVKPDDRDVWLRIGLALHLASSGDDDAFSVWHAWSAGGMTGDVPAGYCSETDCRYHWQSFNLDLNQKTSRVTLGTLFALAQAGGYESKPLPALPEDLEPWLPVEWYTDDDLPARREPNYEPEPEKKVVDTGQSQQLVGMRFAELADLDPPLREWAIQGWVGRGHVTLLAGPPGSGKTAVAQSLAAACAMGIPTVDEVPGALTTLLWAGEDDHDEIWRRQIAIARWLGKPLADFAGRMHAYPCPDVDITLCYQGEMGLTKTPMIETLRQQIGDLGCQLVFLDSIARLFGGNENDRHQVTQFIAWLNYALAPTNAAIVLLGHPSKGVGSEFSGSTAWEASVRARLYFGYHMPGTAAVEGEIPNPDERWLAKRKTNYSQMDARRVLFQGGCMQPQPPDDKPAPGRRSPEFLADEVVAIVQRLARIGVFGVVGQGPSYLPKMIEQAQETNGLGRAELITGMLTAVKAGRLKNDVIGQYSNRSKRFALVAQNDQTGG